MKILFYETENNHCPMKEFLQQLNQRAKKGDKYAKLLLKKIYYSFELLQKQKGFLPKEIAKKVTNHIWELRPLDHRVFYFFWANDYCVILHPFRKDTRKTAQLEIQRAEEERKDWIRRFGEKGGNLK